MERVEYVQQLEELAMHLRNAQRAVTDEQRTKSLAKLLVQGRHLLSTLLEKETE